MSVTSNRFIFRALATIITLYVIGVLALTLSPQTVDQVSSSPTNYQPLPPTKSRDSTLQVKKTSIITTDELQQGESHESVEPYTIKGESRPEASWCDLIEKGGEMTSASVRRMIAKRVMEVQPPVFKNLTDIKSHLFAIRDLLEREGRCMSAARAVLLGSGPLSYTSFRGFFDLGSRTGDQLREFQLHFPEASKFQLFPFEANPAFNSYYKKQPTSTVHYNNFAVGVQNGTLLLTDRSVGSSIVDGSKGGGSGGIPVKVIDFAEFLGDTLSALISGQGGSKVIVKMDIEKMEYPVLHRMLLTGTLLYIDDLLLECHHTSNKPMVSRAPHDIGKEECIELVTVLGKTLSTDNRPFTSVLWNNRKTAKWYTKEHGGFFPT